MCAVSLARPLALFRRHQEEFARDNHGRYVVIHEDDVEGFYDDQLDAYLEAKAKFPPGSFLVRQCVRPEEERVVVFRSRAAG